MGDIKTALLGGTDARDAGARVFEILDAEEKNKVTRFVLHLDVRKLKLKYPLPDEIWKK